MQQPAKLHAIRRLVHLGVQFSANVPKATPALGVPPPPWETRVYLQVLASASTKACCESCVRSESADERPVSVILPFKSNAFFFFFLVVVVVEERGVKEINRRNEKTIILGE